MEAYHNLTSIPADLNEAYRLMSQDSLCEADALEWIEALISDTFSVSAAATDENG
jgi:hypothetical protein